MDRVMVMCSIRLSSCISNMDSKSAIQVIDALIRGETEADKLVKLVYANCTKGSFFKDKFTKLSMRKSTKKALIAIGRKILVIVWHILREKTQYNPNLVHVYDPVKVEHKIKYHEREIEKAKKIIH